MNFSAPQENEKPVEDQVMEFALKKMESYGFHKSRCQKALVKANHDVGNAFEDLMTELFELVYDVPQGKANFGHLCPVHVIFEVLKLLSNLESLFSFNFQLKKSFARTLHFGTPSSY